MLSSGAPRNGHYRRTCAEEERDTDSDGVPDVYEANEGPGDADRGTGR
jgi:hypothetical protein